MLQLASIEKSFVDQVIFRGASLQVSPGERLAVVGPNGSGKTTLLRIIGGEEALDGGQVVVAPGVRIGYLKQDVTETEAGTLLEETLSALPEVSRLESELQRLEAELSDCPASGELLARYGELVERFEVLGGNEAETRARSILTGLGFPPEKHHHPVRSFSGGWMMRISLAKLLLREPDLLLLDEPTNHLDLETIGWLEEFLADYRGTVVLVSHDQHFLNRVAGRVVEISNYSFTSYAGNYDDYLVQKVHNLEVLESQYRNQQRLISQYERFITRFRYKSGTLSKQVQSRIKMLDRIERIELPGSEVRSLSFHFPQPPRSALHVVELAGVTKAYGTNTVFRNLDFTVLRGQKIAVVGQNGAGKSTLLKVMAGVEPIQAGSRTLGGQVSLFYYAQHQLDILDSERTVLEELATAAPEFLPQQLRRLAGAFLFSDDEVDKPIAVLSGGERARVALAKMLAHPANLLVLDEPTNHLDIQARQVLEEALQDYSGTFILITHDRQFIDAVATSVLEVQRGRLHFFDGDYEYYRWKKEQLEAEAAPQSELAVEEKAPRESTRRDERRARALALQERQRRLGPLQHSLADLEVEIARLEGEKSLLVEEICQPSLHADKVAYPARLKRLQVLEGELSTLYERWTRAGEALEAELRVLENAE